MGNSVSSPCNNENQLDMVSASATGSAPYYLYNTSIVLNNSTSHPRNHSKLQERKLTSETESASSEEYDPETSLYFSVQDFKSSQLRHANNSETATNNHTQHNSDKDYSAFHGSKLTERTLAYIPVDPSKPSFEYVNSHVTNEATGEVYSAEKVLRGTTRLETLTFHAHQPLVNLKRHVVTFKKMGFAYIKVATEDLELGSFASSTHKEPRQCQLPPQHVPDSSLSKGIYRIHITYTAQNFGDHVLREETVEFSII